MAEEAPETPGVPRWRYLAVRALRGAGVVFVGLLLLLAIAVAMLDTGAGHRLIVDRIAKIAPSSGLRIRIGRIDGSIWSRATIRDLRLYDTKGLFLEAPEIALDWTPAAWMANRLSIDRLESDLVVLERLPRLKPTKQGPLLPGFDIHVGKLRIAHLRLGAPVSGAPRVVNVEGGAEIRKGRALVKLMADSNARDRLRVNLDVDPDRNRFDVDARIVGPERGVFAGLIGVPRPIDGVVEGKGSYAKWRGAARVNMGALKVVYLRLSADGGRYGLNGILAPSSLLKGKLQRLTAPVIRIDGGGTLADRRFDGSLAIKTPEIEFAIGGVLDLADNAFEGLTVDGKLHKPPALFPNMTGRNIKLHAQFDGPFATAAYSYALTADHVASDNTGFDVVRADGKGQLSPAPVKLPVRLTARRVTGIGDIAGGILANLKVDGVLAITSQFVTGDGLKVGSDKLGGTLALRLDLRTGEYDVALTGKLLRYFIPGIGIVDVNSELKVVPGAGGRGTMVAGRGRAWVRRFDNSFLRYLAGGLPQIDTRLRRGPDQVIYFDKLVLTGPSIKLTGNGYRRRDGTFYFKGSGQQAQYGPVELVLDGNISRPKIDLVLASPLPALGLSNVKLGLDPTPEGFRYAAAGGSRLGPFTSEGAILLPANAPATIQVAAIDVSGAHGVGSVRSDPGGFTGRVDWAGGTVTGPMLFDIRNGLQAIEMHLLAQRARFAAETPISIGRGRFDGTVTIDPAGAAIDGRVGVAGASMGGLSLARGRADLQLKSGNGTIRANLAGSRGRGFQLATTITLAPDSVTVTGEGAIERKPIKLDAPALLRREGDGWRLGSTSLSFAGGKANIAGLFGGSATELHAGVSAMPLSLLDLLYPQLGLSGTATGKLDYSTGAGRAPTGRADLKIKGMSRSGLILTSRPADVAVAAVLTPDRAAARAVVSSGGKVVGRAQGRISGLAPGGDLADRLVGGGLFAQLRYNGPADTLWRLIGVETIDISGPVTIGADIDGTGADPRIRGSLQATAARLESAVSGTVVTNIAANGRFGGSRLVIDKLSGQTKGGGKVSGRAAFDFAGGRGFTMDVAIDADNAQLLNRDDIGATVTGPLTITSDGNGGTIAGDVKLNRSRFVMGRAAAIATIPQIRTTELNRPDADEDAVPRAPWKLDIKADARNQLMVSGLGLDSEWRAKLDIGGTIENPKILGRADLMRGGYQFAGRRFDLDRGSIRFLGETPPDPVLDIVAKANINNVSATITVSGTGQRPDINFASTPSLPEDELLSRLLFGTSITNLSAPEALQLAAAVGGLRNSGSGGGVGLDPINAIRRATGLDRLRILPADPTTGQETSVAVGKYIGRRTFVEVISDGAGYSATRVEFQITRWLSLLSSISSIGRQSASVRVSKDY